LVREKIPEKKLIVMLKISNITKSFDSFFALDDVSLFVDQGVIHAVIGPNGAGKTTFFNIISGILTPDNGSVYFKGKNLTKIEPHKIVQLGIARSFQRVSIFPRKTVFENIQIALIARDQLHRNPFKKASNLFSEEVEKLLKVVNLFEQIELRGGDLSHGMQKQLELAIALASQPKILLLDEPTAGMSLPETQSCIKLLKNIAQDRALTLLFTEHDMQVVFEMADYISVLHHGRLIASGPPSKIRENSEVKRVYLGNKAL